MFYLIGHPLGHSYSVPIHESFGRYGYSLLDLAPDSLPAFMQAFRDGRPAPIPGTSDEPIEGINITIPYKRAVLPFLDEVSETAREAGCVNTVVHRAGRLVGYNTDLFGFETMLTKAGITPDCATRALILGSGGTAGTAIAVLRRSGVSQIAVRHRDTPGVFPDGGSERSATLLVNATPVGMFPHNDGIPLSLIDCPDLTAVADVIYNPLRTRLILTATDRGLQIATGLSMLVFQAAEACALFSGKPAPDPIPVLESLSRDTENIVLTGMPGAGKSTVGAILAEQLSRRFVDSDGEIARITGKTPASIIESDGEAAFREIESRVIADLSKQTKLIVATGGGAVVKRENAEALRQNGRLYYLDRALSHLPSDGRPLSRNLPALFAERDPLYRAACDAVIPVAENDPALVADLIRKEFFSRHE